MTDDAATDEPDLRLHVVLVEPEIAARARRAVEAMLEGLRTAALPVEASSDAGDYLCNYAFYRALSDEASDRASRPVAFLHLPPLGGGSFTLDDLTAGVKAAAAVLARALAHAMREPLKA